MNGKLQNPVSEINFGIIASKIDQAAMVQATLLEEQGYKIYYQDNSILFTTTPLLPFTIDAWIVLSKHSSKSEYPTLTTHSVGNYGPADMGGNPTELGISFSPVQSMLLSYLAQYKQQNDFFKDFDVVAEATHHGPTINRPVTFIEMGSTPEVWQSKKAATAIAYAVTTFLANRKRINLEKNTPTIPNAIAFGGTHYPEKFSKLMIDREYNIGHICPKYAMGYLNENLILQMVEKTIPRPTIGLIEKKGAKKKSEIKHWLYTAGLEILEV